MRCVVLRRVQRHVPAKAARLHCRALHRRRVCRRQSSSSDRRQLLRVPRAQPVQEQAVHQRPLRRRQRSSSDWRSVLRVPRRGVQGGRLPGRRVRRWPRSSSDWRQLLRVSRRGVQGRGVPRGSVRGWQRSSSDRRQLLRVPDQVGFRTQWRVCCDTRRFARHRRCSLFQRLSSQLLF
jgi:hypothetical protein